MIICGHRGALQYMGLWREPVAKELEPLTSDGGDEEREREQLAGELCVMCLYTCLYGLYVSRYVCKYVCMYVCN
jgi:hypothetical protein